jgi:hypothetical protein
MVTSVIFLEENFYSHTQNSKLLHLVLDRAEAQFVVDLGLLRRRISAQIMNSFKAIFTVNYSFSAVISTAVNVEIVGFALALITLMLRCVEGSCILFLLS